VQPPLPEAAAADGRIMVVERRKRKARRAW